MAITVKQLLEMVEKMNIPEDAEIWMEYPARYGVLTGSEEHPTFEHLQSQSEMPEDSDWISSYSLGWSPGSNKLRIFHHY